MLAMLGCFMPHDGAVGGPLGLAPRVSIAAEVLVLAALSSQLQEANQLTRDQYALLHPAGALGAKARGD